MRVHAGIYNYIMSIFFCTDPDRLTSHNQILLVVGVVLLCVALATAVILIVLRVHIKGDILQLAQPNSFRATALKSVGEGYPRVSIKVTMIVINFSR